MKHSKNKINIIIFLMVVIITIAGIISCSGENITGSSANSYSYWEDITDIELPGTNEIFIPSSTNDVPTWGTDNAIVPTPTPTPEPTPTPTPTPKPTYETNTYLNVYAPFTKWDNTDGYNKRISYKDTNTITELWKLMIANGDGTGQGRRWFIRDGDNHSQAYPYEKMLHYTNSLNYYYFDKNFDIVHAGKYAHKVKLKKFIAGVIVKYSRGDKHGTWTIGGLYQWVLNHTNPNTEGQKGYTRYNNDNLNEFMRGIHGWGEGDLSVILMNLGRNDRNHDQFGVDEYYSTVDRNYRRNPEYFIGVDPSLYMGTEQYGWKNEKLNVRVNHAYAFGFDGGFNYKFFPAKPLDWHLE